MPNSAHNANIFLGFLLFQMGASPKLIFKRSLSDNAALSVIVVFSTDFLRTHKIRRRQSIRLLMIYIMTRQHNKIIRIKLTHICHLLSVLLLGLHADVCSLSRRWKKYSDATWKNNHHELCIGKCDEELFLWQRHRMYGTSCIFCWHKTRLQNIHGCKLCMRMIRLCLKWKDRTVTFMLFICASLILSKYATLEPKIETFLSAGGDIPPTCEPEMPCRYSDKVDLRIIVMTFNRAKSLQALLQTLDFLELDSQSASMEIWIDRNVTTGNASLETVKVASDFVWSRGPTRVHIQMRPAGLYNQWINTWRPPNESDDELGLFLEDDLSISKYSYRWLRAVFRAFGNRTDFVGASLVGYQLEYLATKRRTRKLEGPKNHTVFMYKCFGWWGFSPKPRHWIRFQVCAKSILPPYFTVALVPLISTMDVWHGITYW